MTEMIKIPVNDIEANPYQTRFDESPERVASLALSIAQNGLLQPPTVRKVGEKYQLAFGHTRTSAYRLCNAVQLGGETEGLSAEFLEAVRNSAEDFSRMPVFISEIDEERMFRHAVTENAQRSDLSPVEEATAMKRAMTDFHYTSDQAGALFGKSGATVRGKVRLLDLPKEAIDKVHEGVLSEGAARLLITLDRILPEETKGVIRKIVEENELPEEAVDWAFRRSEKTKIVYSSNFDAKAKTFKHLPDLSSEEIIRALDIEKNKRLMNCVKSAKNTADLVQMWKFSDFETDHALAVKVEHLAKPPACSACDLFATVDGSDYCGWLACFDRKTASSNVSKLESASKNLGIAIYQESDGNKRVLNSWNDTHKKWVDKRNPDLRLLYVANGNSGGWGYKLGIDGNVAVVAVGDLLEKLKKAEAQSAADQGKVTKDSSPEERIKAIKVETSKEVVRDAFDQLVLETFVPFMDVLEGVKSEGALDLLSDMVDLRNERSAEIENEKRSATANLTFKRHRIVAEMIDRALSWDATRAVTEAKLPATELAKHIRKIAETWGVKLGKNFDQAVLDADQALNEARRVAIEEAIRDVAVETGKKGKSK